MKISLGEKDKIAKFIMVLKGASEMNEIISIRCMPDKFYLQVMDKGLCGIVESSIIKDWFDEYEGSGDMYINANTLVKVMDCWSPGYIITITENEEHLIIEFNGNKMISKRFKIIKLQVNSELFDIPEKEYDIDIVLSSDGFKDIIDELKLFDTTLAVNCDMNGIIMKTSGGEGSGSIKIKDDDILEYAVSLNEGDTFKQNLDILKISNCCNINKLNKEVRVHFSDDQPLKIHYSLDSPDYNGEPSYIRFFIAPKIL